MKKWPVYCVGVVGSMLVCLLLVQNQPQKSSEKLYNQQIKISEHLHSQQNITSEKFNRQQKKISEPRFTPKCGNIGKIIVKEHSHPTYNSSVVAKRRLIVISIFPLVTDPGYKKTNLNAGKEKHTARMLDFLESVQHSLSHPLVSKVHIPYNQDAMPEYVLCRLGNNPRLFFDRVNDTYNVKKVLEYVHENFQGELIMITNGDVYPGQGLEHLDYDFMKTRRLFYTPTRHGRLETRCNMFPDLCDPEARYIESHDSYIFIPTETLSENVTAVVKPQNWDSQGAEYAMLYMYKMNLNYKVLNPCMIIFLYHNHCSKLRHTDREWHRTKYMYAAPIYSLS